MRTTDSITVRVKFFAAPREALDRRQVTLDLPSGSTVRALLVRLTKRYPPLEPYLPTLSVAVNRAYADKDTELHNGDEVACLPPVSGG